MKALNTTLQAPDSTEVTNVLYFPTETRWLNGPRGYQAGGKYKCGSCVVPSESFVDAACCNRVPHRSLADAQAHVLDGKKSCVKPFDGLSVQEVRRATRRLDTEGGSKEIRR